MLCLSGSELYSRWMPLKVYYDVISSTNLVLAEPFFHILDFGVCTKQLLTQSKIIVEYALLVARILIFGELARSLGSRFICGRVMKFPVADSDLRIRRGPVSNFFRPFGPQFGLKTPHPPWIAYWVQLQFRFSPRSSVQVTRCATCFSCCFFNDGEDRADVGVDQTARRLKDGPSVHLDLTPPEANASVVSLAAVFVSSRNAPPLLGRSFA